MLETRFPITAEKLSVAKETLLSMKTTQVNFTVAFCMNSIRLMFRYFLCLYQSNLTSDNKLLDLPWILTH